MQTIDVSLMKSGDSKTEFEKIDDEYVMEYVVQVRSRKVAEILQQANEIDQATQARMDRIASDNAHTANLRALSSLESGGKLQIENTHS
jgi:hypothetical protein